MADKRVPHYIGKDGLPKPYSQKFLENRRKEIIKAMPPINEE